MKNKKIYAIIIASSLIFSGCGGGGGGGGGSSSPSVVSTPPTNPFIPGTDSGTTDSGATDSGTTDSGTTDSGTADSGTADSGTTNSGTTNSGTTNSGTTVSGSTESGTNPSVAQTQVYWETNEYKLSKLDKIGAWQAYAEGYTGQGVTVAIIDSGVNTRHSELNASFVEGKSFNSFIYSEALSGYIYDDQGFSNGQIEEILVANSGTNYNNAPNVTIVGDGTGATAKAILDGNGHIAGIVITNPGSGYTYATVQIDGSGTTGTGLTIDKVILAEDDVGGHGTAVASIIAGTKDAYKDATNYDSVDSVTSIQGVAFEATIMPIKIFDSASNAYTFQLESALDYVSTQNVQVTNLSLGTNNQSAFNDVNILNSFRGVLDNNTSIVIASGNEGLDCLPVSGSINGQCSFPAATPWVSGNSDLLTRDGAWVVVGSVDSNNVISWFSNKAGITKTNYLVAPGENIVYADTNGGYGIGSGTSYAAPYVSGAIALMYEKYPHLTGNQIAQILFQTATDLGDVGVDDIYGNGLINLEKAFSPIGTLSVPTSTTVSGSKATLTNTKLILPKVFGNSLALKTQSLTSDLNKTMALDDFDRGFSVNVGSAVVNDSDSEAHSFDHYRKMKYKNMIIGVSEYEDNIMIGYNNGDHTIMFTTKDDYFGLESDGLFSINGERSYYLSYVNNLDITDKLSLKNQIDYGYATANAEGNGLITKISDAQSLGFTTVLSYENVGIFYSMPRRIISGNMEFNIPVARDISGNISYLKDKESLKTESYEQDFGVMFSINNMLVKLTHKDNLDNIDGLTDNVILFSYNYIF